MGDVTAQSLSHFLMIFNRNLIEDCGFAEQIQIGNGFLWLLLCSADLSIQASFSVFIHVPKIAVHVFP